MGNIRRIPCRVRKAISSWGILMRHNYLGLNDIFDALYEWTKRNPPPANMVLISDDEDVEGMFEDYLLDFEACGYKVIRGFPCNYSSEDWQWKNLLKETHLETNSEEKFNETGEPPWFCRVCEFPSYSYGDLTEHLKGSDHKGNMRSFGVLDQMNKKKKKMMKMMKRRKMMM